jgi:hypothetical protein
LLSSTVHTSFQVAACHICGSDVAATFATTHGPPGACLHNHARLRHATHHKRLWQSSCWRNPRHCTMSFFRPDLARDKGHSRDVLSLCACRWGPPTVGDAAQIESLNLFCVLVTNNVVKLRCKRLDHLLSGVILRKVCCSSRTSCSERGEKCYGWPEGWPSILHVRR